MHRNTRTKRNKHSQVKSLGNDSKVFTTLNDSSSNEVSASTVRPELVIDVTGTFVSDESKHHRRNAMTSDEMHTILHDINHSPRLRYNSVKKKERKPPLRSRRCETWDDKKFIDMQFALPNCFSFPKPPIRNSSSGRRNRRCDAWDDVQFEEHYENGNT